MRTRSYFYLVKKKKNCLIVWENFGFFSLIYFSYTYNNFHKRYIYKFFTFELKQKYIYRKM